MVNRWRENLGSQLDLRTLAVARAKRKCGSAYTPFRIQLESFCFSSVDGKSPAHALTAYQVLSHLGGRNHFPMVSKEGQPALGRVRISRCSFHPTRDGSFGKVKAEHEEFPMYPRCSPGWVVSNHPKDQPREPPSASVFSQRPSGLWRSASSTYETSPVPADNCFGRNDDEGFLPSRPDPPSNDKRAYRRGRGAGEDAAVSVPRVVVGA
jgi:hypothetical protein